MINVPNGQTIMENHLYHQIVSEHINYYTPQSLMTLAKNCGFEIVEVQNEAEWIELTAFLRKPNVRISFDESRKCQKKALNAALKGERKFSIWGAGAKCTKYAELLDENAIVEHLFDKNESKQGLYVSKINCPIEVPNASTVSECKNIVIFASSYNNEIIKELRETLHYKGRIIYFEGDSVKIL